MKILYVTTVISTVNAFLIPHLTFLKQLGHEVAIACNPSDGTMELAERKGIRIHEIPFQRNPFSWQNIQALPAIRRLVDQEGYQLVHVHTPVASFLTRFSLRKKKSITIVYTAHGFHFYKGAPPKNWLIYYPLERIAARWTDCMITMNDEDYLATRKFRLRKGGLIYQIPGVGIKRTRFEPLKEEEKRLLRQRYGYREEDFIVIYVAELSTRKNQRMAIEAIHLLKEELQTVKLLLVGDGDKEEEYKKLVKKLHLEQQVHFLGYRDDIPELLAISDVLISTSWHEGLPVHVMEGMATGLPLVVTNCRGNRDLVEDGKNGIIIAPGDEKELAAALQRLYLTPDLRSRFSKANLERIQHYDLSNVLNKMGKIYKLCLKETFSNKLSG